ncbi:hypothetical protein [Streptomyces thermolineatus]|uniref:hypothetical protein n=1 Tax=Streptomyces thermolineatus TaxID=44033 RepID=UPI00385077AB
MTSTDGGRTARLLRLYPAAYRQAHGDEIAAIHAEATAGAGPVGRLREDADVAAHALRVRLRITSTDPAGRLLAAAAPYAVAGSAAWAALAVVRVVAESRGGWGGAAVPLLGPAGLLLLIAGAATAVAAVCAAAGRWRSGRALFLAGAVALLVHHLAALDLYVNGALRVPAVVAVALVVLGCPPDLPPTGRRDRAATAAVASATFVPGAAMYAGVPGLPGADRGWWALVVLAAALFAVLRQEGAAARFRAAGVLVAVALHLGRVAAEAYAYDLAVVAAVLCGAAALAAVTVRRFRTRTGAAAEDRAVRR